MNRAELLSKVQRARRRAASVVATATMDGEFQGPAAQLFDELEMLQREIESPDEHTEDASPAPPVQPVERFKPHPVTAHAAREVSAAITRLRSVYLVLSATSEQTNGYTDTALHAVADVEAHLLSAAHELGATIDGDETK